MNTNTPNTFVFNPIFAQASLSGLAVDVAYGTLLATLNLAPAVIVLTTNYITTSKPVDNFISVSKSQTNFL
jgi:hypothetical protein